MTRVEEKTVDYATTWRVYIARLFATPRPLRSSKRRFDANLLPQASTSAWRFDKSFFLCATPLFFTLA
jgi:hypothetical protein